MSKSEKILELESIRGLAAIVIFFFHIPKWNPLLDVRIINNGDLVVQLFFVISGFVICRTYGNKIFNVKDLLRFQFLRFGRLYPVHLLFLLIFIFIELAKYFAEIKLGLYANTAPFKSNSITAIFQHIFLIQAIGPTNNAITFNIPAWSISVEFYTYLIFALVVLLINKKKYIYFFFLAFASLSLLIVKKTYGFEYFIGCIAGFFIGCLTLEVINRIKINISNYSSLIIILLIALFLQLKTNKQYDFIIYFLTSALIASLVLSKNSYLNKVLNIKILTWLGSISYAIYMSHSSIIWIFQQFFRVILKKPEIMIEGKSIPQLSTTETLITCIFLIITVLAVSTFVHRIIERPLREKSRNFILTRLT
jgi:peptidoglycan/LPS O-acetylase OafA/YrhL